MIALLDGKPIPGEALRPDTSIRALLDRAAAQLLDTGCIVFGVRCDGEDVPPGELDEVMKQPVSTFERVELISGRPRKIVLEVLEETRRSFADTFATIQQASDDFAAGRVTEGMNRLMDCVGVWSSVHEAIVRGGALVGVDFDRLVINQKHILDWLRDLSSQLRDIKNATEAKDHVLLGDILRYELDETLRGWETMLNGFEQHVRDCDDLPAAAAPAPLAATG